MSGKIEIAIKAGVLVLGLTAAALLTAPGFLHFVVT